MDSVRPGYIETFTPVPDYKPDLGARNTGGPYRRPATPPKTATGVRRWWEDTPHSEKISQLLKELQFANAKIVAGVDFGPGDDSATVTVAKLGEDGTMEVVESYHVPPAKADGSFFGLNRHPVKRLGRAPALPTAKQCKACPNVRYSILKDNGDKVVILAMSRENEGWGRLLRVEGHVWRMLCQNTNAPMGEVALLDDDLETILNASDAADGLVLGVSPRPNAHKSDDQLWKEEHLELAYELFISDPDVIAHVRQRTDSDHRNRDAYERGMKLAWKYATNPIHSREPEAGWGLRCEARASVIIGERKLAEEEASE